MTWSPIVSTSLRESSVGSAVRTVRFIVSSQNGPQSGPPYPGSGEDGGKTAHYMLRWVATTGEKGPWRETASATIGA